MKRLFSRRTNDKINTTIDPYTMEEDKAEIDKKQEILMGHTNGTAYQNISIGTSRKNPSIRRKRMMSLESDFRISRGKCKNG